MVEASTLNAISTSNLNSAHQAFQSFVNRISRTASVVAMHDSDADGVTAGVVWQRAFERAGFEQIIPLT